MSAAERPAGAAPKPTPDWHSINWSKVWRTVRRLQARIVAIRSIFSTCNALCKGGPLTLPDVPPSVCYPSGPHHNGEVRSLGDNVTSIYGSVVNARADTATASITAVGGQQPGAGSTQVKCC